MAGTAGALRSMEYDLAAFRAAAGLRRVRGRLFCDGGSGCNAAAGSDAGLDCHPISPARGRRKSGKRGIASAAVSLGRSRGGFSTKLHIRADGNGLPLRFALTGGERHDLAAVPELLDGVCLARTLVVADRGYDADDLRSHLLTHGALPVIPARRNRREHVEHDRAVYRSRNRIERLVSKLKQFRRVATRYDQTAASFLAFVELGAMMIWSRYVHAA